MDLRKPLARLPCVLCFLLTKQRFQFILRKGRSGNCRDWELSGEWTVATALYIPTQQTTLAKCFKWDFSEWYSRWTPLQRPVPNRKSVALDWLISIIKGTEGGFILLACTPARWKHHSGKCAQHLPTALGLPRALIPQCPAARGPTAVPAGSGVSCSACGVQHCPEEAVLPPCSQRRGQCAPGAFLQLSESLGCVTHLPWVSLGSYSMCMCNQNEPLAVSQLLAVIHLW